MERNLTVLIAEDNEDDAFLLERAFRSLGLKNPIQIVPDGEQVIAYLQGHGQVCGSPAVPVSKRCVSGHQNAAQRWLRRAGVA
jgi:CheY-like chemotaxis protein